MLLTDQTSSIISTYTADVSGVCSALFELGGMCIMHDASGCNSTYNTHDEPRWYNTDSMVYISSLSEMDAVMGDDKKLVNDIVHAVSKLKPNFIAIAGTPIPSVIGTDLEAAAREVQLQTDIPSFSVPTDGMHSYLYGAGLAFLELVRRFSSDFPKTEKMSVNVIGSTPLDFSVNGYMEDLYTYLIDNGFEIIAKLGMGTDFESVKKISSAHVNLVVSSCGIPAARWLKERYGTPYLIGIPIKGNDIIADTLKQVASGSAITACFNICGTPSDTYIIHEAVTAASAAEYARACRGISARIICPPDTEPCLIGPNTFIMDSENKIRDILKDAKRVIADPLFKPICPESAEFIPFAHEAFSGRIYRNSIPNLLKDI